MSPAWIVVEPLAAWGPLAALAVAGIWLARSWLQQPAPVLILRGGLLAVATVPIAAIASLGMGWLIEHDMNVCEEAARSHAEWIECDPGAAAFLAAAALGLLWLLPGALGLAVALAAALKWLFVRKHATK